MIHPFMATNGELRDGHRTALRLARLYIAGDAWRGWRARAATADEAAYASGKQARARGALRSVEAHFEDEFLAYFATIGHRLPILSGVEFSRIIAGVRRVAERRMPVTAAERRRAAAEAAMPPSPMPKPRKRKVAAP